jgi:hypothetical protein
VDSRLVRQLGQNPSAQDVIVPFARQLIGLGEKFFVFGPAVRQHRWVGVAGPAHSALPASSSLLELGRRDSPMRQVLALFGPLGELTRHRVAPQDDLDKPAEGSH